jgi:hypothetical protein
VRHRDYHDQSMLDNAFVKGKAPDDTPGWGAMLGFVAIVVLAVCLGLWAGAGAWHLAEYIFGQLAR